MCKARKGRERSKMSCSSGREKSQSFTHDLRQADRQVERLCEVFVWMVRRVGISWYPWSVQITGLRISRSEGGTGWKRMLEHAINLGTGMENAN